MDVPWAKMINSNIYNHNLKEVSLKRYDSIKDILTIVTNIKITYQISILHYGKEYFIEFYKQFQMERN